MARCRAISGCRLTDCEVRVCEHTSTLWLTSLLTSNVLVLSTAMSVQECALSSSLEPYAGCSRLPSHCACRSTDLATWFTPANFMGSNSVGNIYSSQKRAHLRPHLSSDLRCCYADCDKVLVCCQKSQLWKYLFTLLPSLQKAEYARQKQQHMLLLCKSENHSVLSLQRNQTALWRDLSQRQDGGCSGYQDGKGWRGSPAKLFQTPSLWAPWCPG